MFNRVLLFIGLAFLLLALAGFVVASTRSFSRQESAFGVRGEDLVLPTPVPMDDIEAGDEDSPITIPVSALLSNDRDPSGSHLTLAAVSNAYNGTVVLADGIVTYTPDANFAGSDSFTYRVCNSGGACASATVHVMISPVNDPPQAGYDSVTTNKNTSLTIATTELLSNDSDTSGSSLTIIAVATMSAHGGTVTLAGDTVTYTPPNDFTGADSFTYRVCNSGGACASASVHVMIRPANDPPRAGDDSVTTDKNTSLTIATAVLLSNDSDVDDFSLKIIAVDAVSAHGGTVTLAGDTVTYAPPNDFTGADSFTYIVSDGHGGTATATVVVTVTPLSLGTPPPTETPSPTRTPTPLRTPTIMATPSATGLPPTLTTPTPLLTITPSATGLPPTLTTPTPLPTMLIQAEWPPKMEVDHSDSIKVSLVRTTGQTFVPTIEIAGHTAVVATPIAVGTPGVPAEKVFGPEYEACTIGELVGTGFDVKPLTEECQSLEQPQPTWVWSITTQHPGPQRLIVKIEVQWKLKGSQETIKRQIWQSHLDILVTKPLITTGQLDVLSLASGFLGSGLSVPWIIVQLKERAEKKAANRKGKGKAIKK